MAFVSLVPREQESEPYTFRSARVRKEPVLLCLFVASESTSRSRVVVDRDIPDTVPAEGSVEDYNLATVASRMAIVVNVR